MPTPRMLALTALTTTGLLLGGPALAGGGGGSEMSVCPAYAEANVALIVLRDGCFGPISAVAEGGNSITIRNDGASEHTYTAVDGSFDTGLVRPGESVVVELPETAGTVPVYCTLHADRAGNGMAGTITLAVAAETATAGPSSTALGSSGLALVGGFLVGWVSLAVLRKRREPQALPA